MKRLGLSITVCLACTIFTMQAQTYDFTVKLDQVLRPQAMFKADTVEICIMGDVMMHKDQIDNSAIYGYQNYFKELENRIGNADLAIANMEFTLGGEPYTGYPAFSAPDSYAEYIANCGFDVFLTANNHILDRGRAGLKRTLDIYKSYEDKYGVKFTGSALSPEQMQENYPLMLAIRGMRIALINFTYGTNSGAAGIWPDTYRMNDKQAIAAAVTKARHLGADLIIALPHWGTEYNLHHSEVQEDMAKWLASEGVDVIVGAHPHVVQDWQMIEDGKGGQIPCIYSMGNAISNMKVKEARIGMVVHLSVVRSPMGDVELLEPEFELTWCALPGRLYDSHATVPVREQINKRESWKSRWDWDLMMTTYNLILKETNITDD